MADLMTGSSGYATGSIDIATTQVNDDPVPIRGEASAAKINGPASAIVAMQGILGVGPDLKGSKADLVERLAVALNPSGTIKATTDAAWSGQLAPQLGGMPTGAVTPYAGSTAPNGYLLCDGSAISRTTYTALFGVVGTVYGVGDGFTTFNVPDLRGRVVIMTDGVASRVTSASVGGSSADTLGGSGGAETHTLTEAQIPAHTHAFTTYNVVGVGSSVPANSPDMATAGELYDSSATIAPSTGGSALHNNMQPWLALNYIIKT
jgi:microcystin-dependent protein